MVNFPSLCIFYHNRKEMESTLPSSIFRFLCGDLAMIWLWRSLKSSSLFKQSGKPFILCKLWGKSFSLLNCYCVHLKAADEASTGFLRGKESACSAGAAGSIPGLGSSPEGGNGDPLLFLPGEPHGPRSLAVYSP